MEIWKDIKGYEGIYKISNLGNVKSINFNHTKRERLLNQTKTKTGYCKVNLKKDGTKRTVLIHRLVAQAFIPNPQNMPYVLHKKAISSGGGNESTNLYWGNNSDNMKDRTRDNHFKNPRKGKFGKDNPTSKRVLQCDENNNIIKIWDSATEASKQLNVNHSTICGCCRNEKYRKTAGGYIWKYEGE